MNLPLLLLCFFLWKVLPPQQTTNTRCHTCFPVEYEFTIIAWLVDISVDFLLRYTHSEDTTTYAGVMWEAFGRVGSVSVQGCVMITIPGCLIIYLIIIGDVPSGNVHDGSMHLGVLQEWFGILVLLRSSSLLFLLRFRWSCSGVWVSLFFHPFIFNFIIEQVKFIRQKN
ncbi:hypothetical protein BDE02_08G067900 [Populus trichocarpa]|nr:hypothetical protein BDE02_08G067900 [Populus trichocarpa]